MNAKNYEDTVNSWSEWSKHVLLELERLNHRTENIEVKLNEYQVELRVLSSDMKDIKGIKNEVQKINIDLATIKMKFSIIGAIIGGTAALIVQLTSVFIGLFSK